MLSRKNCSATSMNHYGDAYLPKPHVCKRRWTGAVVELVELIKECEWKIHSDRYIKVSYPYKDG
ncbi:hypothetical protein [Parabacteroides timonensis]|uniref:hypothetical protein n=1 Tax=Parabacteroides timonensis TaxID=1871013 RepID=UPI001428B27E|nr:hypothetical protein [Parabacteroides timonensis]